MLHYLVWCARVLETTSLYYFLTKDKAERDELSALLVEFIAKENGCRHIPGDRYAISVVNVINDLEACEIVSSYWQVPDSEAVLTITTKECIAYPNIPHQYSLTDYKLSKGRQAMLSSRSRLGTMRQPLSG